MDGEVSEALESLAEAERQAREAMREMRQTVGLLGTPPGAPAGTETALPQASDLPELVAGYASAGLRVALDVQGDLTAVSGDTGLAVYRIVQESLANATKRAPGAAAQVSVPGHPGRTQPVGHQRHKNRSPPPLPGRDRARHPGHGAASCPAGRHVLGRARRRHRPGSGGSRPRFRWGRPR